MNPLTIKDTLFNIADFAADPRVLMVNRQMASLLSSHPQIIFIKTSTILDIPMCRFTNLLPFYPKRNALSLAAECDNIEMVKHIMSIDSGAVNRFILRSTAKELAPELVEFLASLPVSAECESLATLMCAVGRDNFEDALYTGRPFSLTGALIIGGVGVLAGLIACYRS
jgi:hypothetical protein